MFDKIDKQEERIIKYISKALEKEFNNFSFEIEPTSKNHGIDDDFDTVNIAYYNKKSTRFGGFLYLEGSNIVLAHYDSESDNSGEFNVNMNDPNFIDNLKSIFREKILTNE